FTDPNQGKASADYIADNKVATKIGVIYDSSDAYSSGIYNAFKTEAAAKGLELVSEQSFTKDS
ncbi:MAG TPA: amino acid ABC transporter substrate-binding protein, partial [Ruminococcaceae bacterium]|nr:amino acid ABC transporter substrate-binding protein [Oscillospiraceae bacterium]